MDRSRSIELLQEQHAFPGPYAFRAFVRHGERHPVEAAVRDRIGTDQVVEVIERPSRNGKWISLHIHVQAGSAEQVLEIYDLLHGLEEVVLTL